MKIKNIGEVFRIIAVLKNFYGRTLVYVSTINALLIVLTFLEVYQIPFPIWLVLLLGVVAVLIIGALDYWLIMKHEYTHINKRNDLKDDLQIIKKELRELKLSLKNENNN